MKVKNLERDPAASLCVLSEAFFGPWVQVDGSVEIVHLPEAMDGLVDYYRRLSGEHPDWDDYRAAMERDRRVLLRLTVTAAGPNRSG
jgi:PPOX class probable F420-dependent enzyme